MTDNYSPKTSAQRIRAVERESNTLMRLPVGGSRFSAGTHTKKKKVSREISVHPSECVLAKSDMGYWDVPEGTDCVEKTWITTKLGTALGLVGSAYHIVAFQPDSAMAALQRATSTTVTMATMGAIFGMATCLSAQAREAPDDPLNYFIGGCSAGIFLGARTHSAMTGTTACLGLGTLAFFTKVGKMEGWKLAGPPKL